MNKDLYLFSVYSTGFMKKALVSYCSIYTSIACQTRNHICISIRLKHKNYNKPSSKKSCIYTLPWFLRRHAESSRNELASNDDFGNQEGGREGLDVVTCPQRKK